MILPSASRVPIFHIAEWLSSLPPEANQIFSFIQVRLYESVLDFIACSLLFDLEILNDPVITRFCSTLPTSTKTTKCTQRP